MTHDMCSTAHNKKSKRRDYYDIPGAALTKMQDPPAWLHVVNTLEVWEWVSNFIPDFSDVRLLIHAGIE